MLPMTISAYLSQVFLSVVLLGITFISSAECIQIDVNFKDLHLTKALNFQPSTDYLNNSHIF
jgi:hypothetical protein